MDGDLILHYNRSNTLYLSYIALVNGRPPAGILFRLLINARDIPFAVGTSWHALVALLLSAFAGDTHLRGDHWSERSEQMPRNTANWKKLRWNEERPTVGRPDLSAGGSKTGRWYGQFGRRGAWNGLRLRRGRQRNPSARSRLPLVQTVQIVDAKFGGRH